MASAVYSHQRAPSADPDDLDRLLDYDEAVEDFLNDIPLPRNNQDDGAPPAAAVPSPKNEDEEVKVKRRRKPIPKLDEDRLLSDAGIPKLRKIAKSKLKFRGKGHEFSDVSRLLSIYQLWLDDLYPRAKFHDAVAMVEKVGHKQRMKVMRKAWLDETKLGPVESGPTVEDAEAQAENSAAAQAQNEDNSHPGGHDVPLHPEQASGSPVNEQFPDEDELDALLAETEPNISSRTENTRGGQRGPFEEADDDEDELDALLAGDDMNRPN